MPVFQLTDELVFPPPHLADADGLLAVGGDLSEKRLLLAYSMGIFPWYSDDSPILWWSPDPRLILIPDRLKVSRSLRQIIRKGIFTVTMDTAFEEVVMKCASIRRKSQQGTWITDEMVEAYTRLHLSGHAHSVESRREGKLVGGLYGVALGRVFFGESMFAEEANASKVAFVFLVEKLRTEGYRVVDCQITTSHLKSLGAEEVRRSRFLAMLKEAIGSRGSREFRGRRPLQG